MMEDDREPRATAFARAADVDVDTRAESVVASLETVQTLRRAQAARPGHAARVRWVKAYQATRFSRTYADMLASSRHGPASRFFLEELYGPHDFADRDAQLTRIVPTLASTLPDGLMTTVARLATVHALSERLDDALADALPPSPDDHPRAAYVHAWQARDEPAARERQIALIEAIGHALDDATRKPMLAASLKLMRLPARAAGLGALQHFLERGLSAFRAMRGAEGFLAEVGSRERARVAALSTREAKAWATSPSRSEPPASIACLADLPHALSPSE